MFVYNQYITSSDCLITYKESFFCVNYSKLNIHKLKYLIYFNYHILESQYLFNIPLVNNILLFNNSYLASVYYLSVSLKNILMLYINECLYSSKGRIKMVGRGYKITMTLNNLIIRLGYSHLIFVCLLPTMRMKFKKKRLLFYTFYGTYYELVNSVMSGFHVMRLPDLYTNKGVFHRRILL